MGVGKKYIRFMLLIIIVRPDPTRPDPTWKSAKNDSSNIFHDVQVRPILTSAVTLLSFSPARPPSSQTMHQNVGTWITGTSSNCKYQPLPQGQEPRQGRVQVEDSACHCDAKAEIPLTF